MKTIISKLAIAITFSITLVTVVNISSYISRKTLPYRSASVSQTQPGPEILGNSVGAVMDNLFASSGR